MRVKSAVSGSRRVARFPGKTKLFSSSLSKEGTEARDFVKNELFYKAMLFLTLVPESGVERLGVRLRPRLPGSVKIIPFALREHDRHRRRAQDLHDAGSS